MEVETVPFNQAPYILDLRELAGLFRPFCLRSNLACSGSHSGTGLTAALVMISPVTNWASNGLSLTIRGSPGPICTGNTFLDLLGSLELDQIDLGEVSGNFRTAGITAMTWILATSWSPCIVGTV
jgi:hypothetical protein